MDLKCISGEINKFGRIKEDLKRLTDISDDINGSKD